MRDKREIIELSEQCKELGQGGGEKGVMGERRGAEKLKHEEKKKLRHCALSKSDVRVEPLSERGRIEEEDFLRDLTNDQNLEGDESQGFEKNRFGFPEGGGDRITERERESAIGRKRRRRRSRLAFRYIEALPRSHFKM